MRSVAVLDLWTFSRHSLMHSSCTVVPPTGPEGPADTSRRRGPRCTLGYTAVHPRPGGYHKFEVLPTGKNLRASYRIYPLVCQTAPQWFQILERTPKIIFLFIGEED